MKRSVLAALCGTAILCAAGAGMTASEALAGSKAQPAAKKASSDGALSGKVTETMNAGGYTYVLIEKGGKKTWVAVPETKVKVGQQVSCDPGMEMKNFTSKTLNRTFDSIVFSGGIH